MQWNEAQLRFNSNHLGSLTESGISLLNLLPNHSLTPVIPYVIYWTPTMYEEELRGDRGDMIPVFKDNLAWSIGPNWV